MDRHDRNQLVEEHLPLVGYVVSAVRARARHLSRDELASAGSLALVKAADSFDPSRGVPFGAYARRRIEGAMQDEMRGRDWATRNERQRFRDNNAARAALTQALGREATAAELAEALGVPEAEVGAALGEQPLSFTPLDLVSDSLAMDAVGPEQGVLEQEMDEVVRGAVAALPEPMRMIVESVYFEDRPVTDVARELGVTHSAVSQHRSEAIRLLRDGLRTHYTDPASERPRESRVHPDRHRAYLKAVAERTAGGFGRTLAGSGLDAAVAA